MYSLTVSAHQAFGMALIHVSLSETDDTGATHVLSTVTHAADDRFPHLAWCSLEEFLDQACVGLSRVLSSVQDGVDQL